MYDNNEDGKCMQASWNSQGSSHRKPNWQHADCPNKSLWTPAFTKWCNSYPMFITRSLSVHYDDLKISQGSSQGSQNQTAGALRRRKSPRQSCPTKTTSSHVVTSIKDADHVQQKWIESGLMIQHDSTWFNMLGPDRFAQGGCTPIECVSLQLACNLLWKDPQQPEQHKASFCPGRKAKVLRFGVDLRGKPLPWKMLMWLTRTLDSSLQHLHNLT
jgi:hypothetical protein